MGFNRLGQPIIATKYGSLRLWEMTKLTTIDRMAEFHAQEQELLLRVLRRRTLEGSDSGGYGNGANQSGVEEGNGGRGSNRPAHIVDTAVIVVDTAGLTLRHVSVRRGGFAQVFNRIGGFDLKKTKYGRCLFWLR